MFPSTQPSQMSSPPVKAATHLLSRLGQGLHSRFSSRLPSQFSSRFMSRFGAGSGLHGGGSTEMSSLSPSLLQDLLRFERSHGEQRELLEVLAACIRHTQSLAVRLDTGAEWVTLSVYPIERLVHCRLPLERALAGALNPEGPGLRVVQVQPATHRPPADINNLLRVGRAQGYAPLAPLMWAVALAGSRPELLPELAGQAAYRVAPGLALSGLPLPPQLLPCVQRLKRETSNLSDIAGWPLGSAQPGDLSMHGASHRGLIGRERAVRLLNALYLQSALIVTRTHPAATNEGWMGYLRGG